MQQSRQDAPTPSAASQRGEANGTGARSSPVQLMRGQALAQQLETLAPRENARGGGGAPVQLKIDAGTLNSKLESDANYNGTIDTDTDCATANSVGAEWVGPGHSKQKYGPPFEYQLLSADGKRQYRPPMVKQQSKNSGQAQANYEARTGNGKHFTFNAHVTVTDIDKYPQKTNETV